MGIIERLDALDRRFNRWERGNRAATKLMRVQKRYCALGIPLLIGAIVAIFYGYGAVGVPAGLLSSVLVRTQLDERRARRRAAERAAASTSQDRIR